MRDFHLPGRSPVYATNAICATSHPVAAQVAVDILRDGGNAADAAIAAAVTLGLCEPAMTGLGGDMFALIKPAGEERVVALNASGRAPMGLDAAVLRRKGRVIDPQSADAVTIPGAVDGFCRLAEDWGKLGLAACLAPAIRYAEEGVPVAPRAGWDWQHHAADLQGAARRFYLSGDRAPATGSRFHYAAQAEVLRRIAREGRAGFYEGEVAADMVASLRALGGSHSEEDFAATRCDWGVPLSGAYRGVEILEHPPNGQGATAILLLKILAQFDIESLDPWGAERAHIEAEATKLAYDARNRFVADPAHMTRLEHMIADETAAKLAALIDPKKAMAGPAPLSEAVHRDTVYLTVVDGDRMAVSMIYSVFHAFGSGLASDRFGILFQNRGAGFTLAEGHPNEAGPSKRPMHTIIPGMMRRNGRVAMPFGVMGGQYQATGHARLISNLTDFGLDVQEALDGPRSFAGDGVLQLEHGYAPVVAAALSALGHEVVEADGPIGGGQAIVIDEANGVLIGGSDPRKDGCAIGY